MAILSEVFKSLDAVGVGEDGTGELLVVVTADVDEDVVCRTGKVGAVVADELVLVVVTDRGTWTTSLTCVSPVSKT